MPVDPIDVTVTTRIPFFKLQVGIYCSTWVSEQHPYKSKDLYLAAAAAPFHISDVCELLEVPPKRHLPSKPLRLFNLKDTKTHNSSIFHKKAKIKVPKRTTEFVGTTGLN